MQIRVTTSRRAFRLALFAACVTAIAGLRADDERSFEFFPFEVDGATYTEAYGINPAGAIVGVYAAPDVGTRGFLLEDGQFTSIAYPQAPGGPAVVRTDARAISPSGDIVGMYVLAGAAPNAMHGYVRTHAGEFFTVDVPGHNGTVAEGILPDGTILGCFHETNMTTTMHGFVRDPFGTFTGYPTGGTMHYGATPDLAQIAGRYVDTSSGSAQHYGYLIDEAGMHLFRVPGTTYTQAWGINPRGEVVGVSRANGAGYRGFVKDGDDFTTLSYPGAIDTYAYGINASGDVVGSYNDGTKFRAFLASRSRGHNK